VGVELAVGVSVGAVEDGGVEVGAAPDSALTVAATAVSNGSLGKVFCNKDPQAATAVDARASRIIVRCLRINPDP
jgi:hypothetical protein